MSGHDEDDDMAGYGKPPREHQFRKGQSGNPKGRPRKSKIERAYSLRQIRRDILAITERKVPVNTPEGRREMAMIEALLMTVANKAVSGHGPSQRFMVKLHMDALTAHEAAHPDEFELLEMNERLAFKYPNEGRTWMPAQLNQFRKLTRRP